MIEPLTDLIRPAASPLTRRRFLSMAAVGASSAALAACTTTPREGADAAPAPSPKLAYYRDMYGAVVDQGYEIPAIPIDKVDPRYYRQEVRDPTGEAPGTIVVDTSNHFLYLVRERGRAMRYGVGLGRAGFEWAGRAVIEWKQPWPKWFPPAEMIERQPELEKYSADNGGMEPGLQNPLGARALYIFENGKDTLYRVHGSPEWWSIGKSVSSGCVRLMNQDAIDLYERVPEGSPILVTSGLATV
ncbi:L,D-transpeptidase [Aquibium sp. A9E412]|uniref:L,D-transpeptidase n=1 Tax=Aquibium sp. A9E412 TaxID=2976767 RepID=UPI0025B2429D|nr:L,D-transpeptidase [Aquibium sp. A9E412]MDN2566376.1 L,D-transpeptidase [Aquibium sp. A9E412]